MTNSKALYVPTPSTPSKYLAETVYPGDIPAALKLIHELTDRLYQAVADKIVGRDGPATLPINRLEAAIYNRDTIGKLISMTAMSDSSFVLFTDTKLAEALAAGDEAEIEKLERELYSNIANNSAEQYKSSAGTMVNTLTKALEVLLNKQVFTGTTAEIEIRNTVEFVAAQWAQFVVTSMKNLAATGYRPKLVEKVQVAETEYSGRRVGLLNAQQQRTDRHLANVVVQSRGWVSAENK